MVSLADQAFARHHHRFDQLLLRVGLIQSGKTKSNLRRQLGIAGCYDHLYLRMGLFNLNGEVAAVHAGHSVIGDHNIKLLGFQQT